MKGNGHDCGDNQSGTEKVRRMQDDGNLRTEGLFVIFDTKHAFRASVRKHHFQDVLETEQSNQSSVITCSLFIATPKVTIGIYCRISLLIFPSVGFSNRDQ